VPAPPVRPAVPTPPMVLTELKVAPAPPALAMPTPFLGEGETELDGLGEGAGDGIGTGTGAGAGSGGASPPARRLTTTWAPDMRFDRLHRRYPAEARAASIAGIARLECEVQRRSRVRDCRLLGEVPAGHGFGEAALQSQPIYRIQVRDQNGDRVYGERIILNAHFRPRS